MKQISASRSKVNKNLSPGSMNVLGTFDKLNDMTSHSYKPALLSKAAFHLSPGLTLICDICF